MTPKCEDLSICQFGITSIHQIVIGSTMSVAQRLCHGAKPFGNKYFVVSTFFAQCLFLTNNKEGDTLLKLILHDELAMEINHAALSPFHPPRIPKVVEIAKEHPDCILLRLFYRDRHIEICKITSADALSCSACQTCINIIKICL